MKYQHFTEDDWKKVVFADESKFEIYGRNRRVNVTTNKKKITSGKKLFLGLMVGKMHIITHNNIMVILRNVKDKCAKMTLERSKVPTNLMCFDFLDFAGKCIGEEAKYEGIRLLFDSFQQPILNKQVNSDTL